MMAPGCDSDLKRMLCSDIRVTARNALASSNEKQMGQFPKKIAAPKASKPPNPRIPWRIGPVYRSPASRRWSRAGPGMSQDIGSKMGQWRCCGAARVEAKSQAKSEA
jgi:hypothetical protein